MKTAKAKQQQLDDSNISAILFSFFFLFSLFLRAAAVLFIE
uniref:Uncharacterized protein n=1 Tax=Arundo donax TaxID=35708 RepID=A0A0A9HNW3_ARUDO